MARCLPEEGSPRWAGGTWYLLGSLLAEGTRSPCTLPEEGPLRAPGPAGTRPGPGHLSFGI